MHIYADLIQTLFLSKFLFKYIGVMVSQPLEPSGAISLPDHLLHFATVRFIMQQ